MRKKLPIILLLVGLVMLLAGCTEVREPITSESTGIWNTIFVYPLSQIIIFFAELLGNSFGLAIIVVTVIVRLLLVPLNVKQLKSSQAMQDIQPEMKKLQEKYKSKDQATQQKLQQETMELFQKHGVNPLAGCLPIFIQMPILIAMYHAIMRTREMEAEQFLWFALSSPDYVLPIVAGALTFLQQKLMMSNSSGNSQQAQMMAVMLYMMPIMITVFGFFLPAALTLYWVIGNFFMIAQTILIRKPMMKEKANGGDIK